MSNSEATIYFVAGATRGLGLGLVATIASRDPSAIIYAGGRNLSASSQLEQLVAKYPGRVEFVKYIAGDKEGNEAVAKEITKKHGRVDTIVANAAIAKSDGKVHETTIENYQEHFSVNVIGPIVLFQAFRDLLKASPLPRFVAISSGGGSIEMIEMLPLENAPYGTSKAALNWVVRKIHCENEWLIAFPQCPGSVDTDMANDTFVRDGRAKEILSPFVMRQPGETAAILLDIINTSTREKDGGQFHNSEGTMNPW